MREIRFRTYWKDEKEMHYLKHLDLEFCHHDEQVELMQYTGLKDKNGVEIYEGDIVNIEDCEAAKYKIEWVGFRCSFECVTINPDDDMWTHGAFDDDIDSESCTVIGNIYENPELLKESNE